jgi:hypothetical protein
MTRYRWCLVIVFFSSFNKSSCRLYLKEGKTQTGRDNQWKKTKTPHCPKKLKLHTVQFDWDVNKRRTNAISPLNSITNQERERTRDANE